MRQWEMSMSAMNGDDGIERRFPVQTFDAFAYVFHPERGRDVDDRDPRKAVESEGNLGVRVSIDADNHPSNHSK